MRRRPLLPVVFCAGLALLCATPVLNNAWADTGNEYSAANLTALRAQGPAGLSRFIAAHEAELAQLKASPNSSDAKLRQLKSALNTVGGAHDNWAAGLYWYTDLDKAKAQAAKEGKPILSLRMLGNLTDAYSCANSRFFRAALYPDAKINAQLRDKFVLHWSRERAVPVVTIDFGDGRWIKRTLTGNSAHYLMDEKGRPLDVLPGLYAPGAFNRWLESAAALYKDLSDKPQYKRIEMLTTWHHGQVVRIWTDYAKAAGVLDRRVAKHPSKAAVPDSEMISWVDYQVQQALESNPLTREVPATDNPYVAAQVAAPLALSKRAGEGPILDATRLYGSEAPVSMMRPFGSPYAATFEKDAKLDDNALKLIESQISWAHEPAVKSVSTNRPTITVAQSFQNLMALDTAQNELQMHVPIHVLFASGQQGSFEELNRRIYDRLFKTPASDPWLGLEQREIFTGLPNSGIVESIQQPAANIREAKRLQANG